jgi:hypothetical protein
VCEHGNNFSRIIVLDKDVAELYGVQTKRINEAIKNNQEKFPLDYVFILNNNELQCLRSKNSTANLSMTRTPPRAFTEKGLYMIATIIKSPKAIATTFEKNNYFRERTRNYFIFAL